MTDFSDLPRRVLDFLISILGWLAEGAREVFELFAEPVMVWRWTWDVTVCP